MNIQKKTIIITGASSGIGAAMAAEYSNPNTRLFLFGRSIERLAQIEKICLAKNAEVQTFTADIRQENIIANYIKEITKQNKIDLLITCAGVSAGTLNQPETMEQVKDVFETNLNGTLNTIMPIIPHMIANKSGTLVFISSMAGLVGLSSAPAYSASKAAVKIFGDALRAYLKKFNITICMVIPGYVETPMTEKNNFPMPLKISAQEAARIIVRGIEKKQGIITFPKVTYYLLKIFNLLPYQIIDYINAKLPGK